MVKGVLHGNMNPYFDIDSIVKIAIMASQHKEYFKERNFRGEKFLRNSRMAFQYAKKEFREKKFYSSDSRKIQKIFLKSQIL